jgi:hypothetical protein
MNDWRLEWEFLGPANGSYKKVKRSPLMKDQDLKKRKL